MKRTTKTLFSLLLVLVMVFQLGGAAAPARADEGIPAGDTEIRLVVFAPMNEAGTQFMAGGEVKQVPDEIAKEHNDFGTGLPSKVSDIRGNGFAIAPAGGFYVSEVYLAASQMENPNSLLSKAKASAFDTSLHFDGSDFDSASVFNGASDSCTLFIWLKDIPGNVTVTYKNGDTVLEGKDSPAALEDTDTQTFAGWWLTYETNGTGCWVDKDATYIDPYASCTLYAQWKPITCTLSFDPNGGSDTMDAITVNKGEAYTVPACGFTAPEGKEFAYWLRGDEHLNPGDPDTITSDNVLVAEWKDTAPAEPEKPVLTLVDEVAATCENAGVKAHYEDAEGNLYADEAGTPVTAEELKISAKGHLWDEGKVTTEPTTEAEGVKTFTCKNDASHTRTESIPKLEPEKPVLTAVAEVAATCEKEGTKAHFTDGTKLFADAEGKTEVAAKDLVISAKGHDWDEGKVTKEATTEAEGEKTFTCKNDASHTSTKIIPRLEKQTYDVLPDGTDKGWTKGSKEGWTIRVDADYKLFQNLTMNGQTVDPKFLSVTKGSTVVTISSEYLESLKAGDYTVTLTFSDGKTASATLTVKDAPALTKLEISYDAKGFTKVYDGKSFDLQSLFQYLTIKNLPEKYEAAVEISYEDSKVTEIHNAGETTVKLSLKSVKDADGKDVSDQFTCEDVKGVKLTITKRKISVETRDDSKVYDGKAWTYQHMKNPQPIMTYTDPKLGEYARDGKTYTQVISMSYTASPKNMGTYDNTAKLIIREKVKGSSEAGTDVTDNYEITYKFGKIKITDANGNVPKNTSPATGDTANIWLWVGLMAAVIVVVVVLLFVKRRNGRDRAAD